MQTPGLQELLKNSEARELGTVVFPGHQEGRKPGEGQSSVDARRRCYYVYYVTA